MTKHNETFLSLTRNIDLGEITETKKQAILDDIGMLLTERIILELLDKAPKDKKDTFVQKINENKQDPDKILLFIDHFVDNADEVIDNEIAKCKEEIAVITKNTQ